jgi:hypothetical protein
MAQSSTLPRTLAATILLAAAFTAAAQDVKLFLVDEGANDPSWARFRARLLDAAEKRDQQFVLGIVDARIRNISDRDGIAEFRKLWEPQSAASPLWTELPKLLFLGGVFVKRERGSYEFCAPYVYYKWPDNVTGDVSGAIIASEVLLKANPAANAPTLQTLSYDLVKVLDWEVADEDKDSKQMWTKLQTGAGIGYVPEEQVRSPLEYRACFVKRGSSWRMTGLEVGE